MITFKRLKFAQSQSRETLAYTADVFWNGRPIGSVRNDGGGDMTVLQSNRSAIQQDDLDQATAHALAQQFDLGADYGGPQNYKFLQDYIDDCAVEADHQERVVRWFHRNTKGKVSFIRGRKAFVVRAAQNVGSVADTILRIRKRHPDVIILNDLGVEKALPLLRSCEGF